MSAKKILKRRDDRVVQVSRMVPARWLSKKNELLRIGAELKQNDSVTSYEVIMRDSTVKLRTYNKRNIRRPVEYIDVNTAADEVDEGINNGIETTQRET